jgi:hypothetical protein
MMRPQDFGVAEVPDYMEGMMNFNRALANMDFIVIVMDARGTPGRSKAFHDAIHNNWGEPAIADHASAIKQLADLADYAPDDPIPLLLQSEWLLESGQKEAAKSSFQTGSILASKNSERYRTLMQDLHSRLYE